jgi:hypothetical protein
VLNATAFLPGARRRKFGNKPVVVDGERFDSKREAKRHAELELLVRAGAIRDLKRQVTFKLVVNGAKVGSVRPDWTYTEGGQLVAEDCKGHPTPSWKTRWALAKALFPSIDWRTS